MLLQPPLRDKHEQPVEPKDEPGGELLELITTRARQPEQLGVFVRDERSRHHGERRHVVRCDKGGNAQDGAWTIFGKPMARVAVAAASRGLLVAHCGVKGGDVAGVDNVQVGWERAVRRRRDVDSRGGCRDDSVVRRDDHDVEVLEEVVHIETGAIRTEHGLGESLAHPRERLGAQLGTGLPGRIDGRHPAARVRVRGSLANLATSRTRSYCARRGA